MENLKKFLILLTILTVFLIPSPNKASSSTDIKQITKSDVIKYYTNKICTFHKIREKRCRSYATTIYNKSTIGKLPHYVLFAILWQESTFSNVVGDRYNKFKAYGLGQLQERTAEEILGRELKDNYGTSNRHELIINYKLNIELTYKNILRHYHHHNDNLNIALRAYNGGRGNIHYKDTKVYASEVEEKIDHLQNELKQFYL